MKYSILLALIIFLGIPFSVMGAEIDINGSISYYSAGSEFLYNWESDSDLIKAVYQFRKSVQLNPFFTQGYIELAYCYLKLYENNPVNEDYYNEIMTNSYKAIDLGSTFNENYSEAYRIMGNALQIRGDYDNAIKFYNFAIEKGSIYAYKDLGELYYTQGNYQECIRFYSNSIFLNPYNLDVYCKIVSASDNLGIKIERYDEYNSICQKGTELDQELSSLLEDNSSANENTNNNTNDSEYNQENQTTPPSNTETKNTPGFEIPSVVIAAIIGYFLLRKRN